MSTATTPVYEWKTIPWKRHQRAVFKLQKRIYQAKRRGNVKAVHRLQRLLVKSWSAKLLAVRRVTQDNRGKRTAGIDGVKNLLAPQRLALASTLALSSQPQPARRVWIPKRGSTEQRPLGIPTVQDRAAQALLKLALEPEWEAVFEPNSYGFRPGRSCHDAVEAIYLSIRQKAKYVLDADIRKCFDRINHAALLHKLQTTPSFRRVIRAWLQAGVMEGPDLFLTDAGTPQGGVISPLLANIALHGLETAIVSGLPKSWQGRVAIPSVIRYADDFIVLHEDLGLVQQAQQLATAWLREIGLELNLEKTRIVHTLNEHAGRPPGFDFLGFTARQFPAGKTHAGKMAGKSGRHLGFRPSLRPSREASKRHGRALAAIVRRNRTSAQAVLIGQLNPHIVGWAQYYSTVSSAKVFKREDAQLYAKLRRWASRRHRHKGRRWIARKYWHPERGRWAFAAASGAALTRHAQVHARKHVKVRGTKSPYDGDWSYWGIRVRTYPELPWRVMTLLKMQTGRCAWCHLRFMPEDRWEIDHIIPTSLGGLDRYENLQLLHAHCHDQKTASDGSLAHASLTTDQTIEEPCEAKVSCTVLQTGGAGRPPRRV